MIGIYIRVSSSKQETRSQRKAIADWCRAKGYVDTDLHEYVDDGVSGKTTDRPAFKQMLGDIDARKITRVITFELSRLSRNFLDLLEVMRSLTERGVPVEVPGEGAVAFENTLEQFMVAARSLVSAQERERISARTKAGLAAARARGIQLGAPKGARRRAGKLKEYDPKIVEQILSLARRQVPCREVAALLGISPSTVVRIRRRYENAPPA